MPGPQGGSRAQARAEGERLLAGLTLPRGARRIGARSVPEPAEEPGGSNVVDVSRVYWLPLRPGSAYAFLLSHPPAGTRRTGYGSASVPAPGSGGQAMVLSNFVSYSLDSPPQGVADDSMVLATVISGPHAGTVVRADAEMDWYPPRSAAEYLRPSAYRSVSVTASFISPRWLVPGNGPLVHDRPRTTTVVLTSRSAIGELVAVLNGLHGLGSVVAFCPYLLAEFRLQFVPVSKRVPVVVVTPDGCSGESVTVGGRLQPALSDPESLRLVTVIGQLLGQRMQPVGPQRS